MGVVRIIRGTVVSHGTPAVGEILVHQSIAVVVTSVWKFLVDEMVAVVVDSVTRAAACNVRRAHVAYGGILLAGDHGVRLLVLQAVQSDPDSSVLDVAQRVCTVGDGQRRDGVVDADQARPVGEYRLTCQRQSVQSHTGKLYVKQMLTMN